MAPRTRRCDGEHILFGFECAFEDEGRWFYHDCRTIVTTEEFVEDSSWPSDNVGRSVQSNEEVNLICTEILNALTVNYVISTVLQLISSVIVMKELT
jgi:hypothetical protein